MRKRRGNYHRQPVVIVGYAKWRHRLFIMKNVLYKLLEHPDFLEGDLWLRQEVAANQTLFAEGEQSADVYLILKGKVRVVGNVDVDDQRTMHTGFSDLEEGQVFGELSLFDGQPRSATVITLTDCEFAQLAGNKNMDFLDAHPDLGHPIFKELIYLLVGRLRQANRRIFSLFAWGLRMRGIDRHL